MHWGEHAEVLVPCRRNVKASRRQLRHLPEVYPRLMLFIPSVELRCDMDVSRELCQIHA